MKKVIALTLTLALALSLAACGKTEKPAESPAPTDAPATEAPATEAPKAEGTYKTGVGTVINAKGTDATADKGAAAQVDTTIVAATFDKDGKIVSATIDVAQQKAGFDAKGVVSGKIDTRTKNEKGADYGMAKVSGIKKEIDAQHAALADWMVGKTVAEVKAMKLGDSADGTHKGIPAEEDLKTSVTVMVGDYIAALEKAEKNAKPVEGEVAKTGLGTVINGKTNDATADKGASAQVDTTIVVAAFDKDGKILSSTIDVAQQKVAFTLEGKVDGTIDMRTKNEKGADYGMAKVSGIKKEIDAQHAALADWMVGKTVAEVKAMKLGDSADGTHKGIPAEEDLKTSVTVMVGDYIAALEKAEKNAK